MVNSIYSWDVLPEKTFSEKIAKVRHQLSADLTPREIVKTFYRDFDAVVTNPEPDYGIYAENVKINSKLQACEYITAWINNNIFTKTNRVGVSFRPEFNEYVVGAAVNGPAYSMLHLNAKNPYIRHFCESVIKHQNNKLKNN